jgi:purine-nucleoside phosphorylase
MEKYRVNVEQSSAWLRARIKHPPEIGLITGTGLGDSTGRVEVTESFEYGEIPHFPVSTVAGHRGRMIFGMLCGRPVMSLQGRFHLYEGYSALDVTFPIRVMRALGARILVIVSAAGGLNPDFDAGDIMLIRDHINLSGENPLAGPNVDDWGPRFPEMTGAYDRELLSLARAAAAVAGGRVREGVYAGLKGSSLETPAEMFYLRAIGADAVGFSTVNEVIAAVHGGMRVLGFAIITNVNVPGRLKPTSLEEIIAVAGAATPAVEELIARVVASLPQ